MASMHEPRPDLPKELNADDLAREAKKIFWHFEATSRFPQMGAGPSVFAINQGARTRGGAQYGIRPQTGETGESSWKEIHKRELTGTELVSLPESLLLDECES